MGKSGECTAQLGRSSSVRAFSVHQLGCSGQVGGGAKAESACLPAPLPASKITFSGFAKVVDLKSKSRKYLRPGKIPSKLK